MKLSSSFISLFFLVSFSLSAATLIPEKGVSVLYINGQKSESKIKSQEIPDGEIQLIVKMDKKLGRGNSAQVFTSEPYVLSFKASGQEIKVKHPIARSQQEAERAFKSATPNWIILKDNEIIDYEIDKLPQKKGLLGFLALDDLVVEYNQSNSIKTPETANMTAVTLTKTAQKPARSKAKNTFVTTNLTQMKAWYLQATPEERKEFRRWIIDQE
ncbi:DUF2057 family protein [Vibrio sp. NTOU-M3]|uniref:YccT family protein n=1 Tax=Vibrio sp. NTOU-M3 TaxID=3234954 RepID=UPI00349FA5A0